MLFCWAHNEKDDFIWRTQCAIFKCPLSNLQWKKPWTVVGLNVRSHTYMYIIYQWYMYMYVCHTMGCGNVGVMRSLSRNLAWLNTVVHGTSCLIKSIISSVWHVYLLPFLVPSQHFHHCWFLRHPIQNRMSIKIVLMKKILFKFCPEIWLFYFSACMEWLPRGSKISSALHNSLINDYTIQLTTGPTRFI